MTGHGSFWSSRVRSTTRAKLALAELEELDELLDELEELLSSLEDLSALGTSVMGEPLHLWSST